MFKLLSKESNIFSIPVYAGFLLLMVTTFNVLSFNITDFYTTLIVLAAVILGYFFFHKINLTYQTHLPLFLYTIFIFAFYSGNPGIGIAVALLTNSFLLLVLTGEEARRRERSYIIVGSILAINYLVMPGTWPMFIFVLMHIVATSNKILLNICRMLMGMLLLFTGYLCIMYFMNYTTFNPEYLPVPSKMFLKNYYPLPFLIPVLALAFYGVFDHFRFYNEKSPVSRYKYTFLLTFTTAQFISVILYMGHHYDYLLILVLPVTVILSRMLRFLPKNWMRELGLWSILLCLLVFKAGTYYKF